MRKLSNWLKKSVTFVKSVVFNSTTEFKGLATFDNVSINGTLNANDEVNLTQLTCEGLLSTINLIASGNIQTPLLIISGDASVAGSADIATILSNLIISKASNADLRISKNAGNDNYIGSNNILMSSNDTNITNYVGQVVIGDLAGEGEGISLVIDNAYGYIKIPGLTTSDPLEAGALWNNAGVVNISAG